jgi:hypothetical protein
MQKDLTPSGIELGSSNSKPVMLSIRLCFLEPLLETNFISILGVKPATSCLDGKKIKLTKDGHVIVNKFMQTSQKDVYAIGDCVEFPLWKNNSGDTPGGERRVTLPYWYLAQVQGKIIAIT